MENRIVNLRTLQQYELSTKDINKASAASVYALTKTLNCNVEDLLEMIQKIIIHYFNNK